MSTSNHEFGILPGGSRWLAAGKVVGRNCNGRVMLSAYLCAPLPGLFDHPVRIYGIPYPGSWYDFRPEGLANVLKAVFENCCE